MIKQERQHQDDDPAGDGQGADAAHAFIGIAELWRPYLFKKVREIVEMDEQGIYKQYGHQQVLYAQHVNVEILPVNCQDNPTDDEGNKCQPCDRHYTASNARPFAYLLICLQAQHESTRYHGANKSQYCAYDMDMSSCFHFRNAF